jgi:hypothetical protein
VFLEQLFLFAESLQRYTLQLHERASEHLDSLGFLHSVRLRYTGSPDQLQVTAQYTSQPYCWEFNGTPHEFFVTTPATERCYIHLMSSFSDNQGCILAGAPGSGKASTVQALANSCGRYLCAFSLTTSVSLSFLQLALVGTVSSGCWSFFSFSGNPGIEILSLIGQFAHAIRFTQFSNSEHPAMFGSFGDFKLASTSGIVLSFRSNAVVLPDSLKQEFRALAYVPPDTIVILEAFLLMWSLPCQWARSLAKLIEFCCDQLSCRSLTVFSLPNVLRRLRNICEQSKEKSEIEIILALRWSLHSSIFVQDTTVCVLLPIIITILVIIMIAIIQIIIIIFNDHYYSCNYYNHYCHYYGYGSGFGYFLL